MLLRSFGSMQNKHVPAVSSSRSCSSSAISWPRAAAITRLKAMS
jgi:hypothetical protein